MEKLQRSWGRMSRASQAAHLFWPISENRIESSKRKHWCFWIITQKKWLVCYLSTLCTCSEYLLSNKKEFWNQKFSSSVSCLENNYFSLPFTYLRMSERKSQILFFWPWRSSFALMSCQKALKLPTFYVIIYMLNAYFLFQESARCHPKYTQEMSIPSVNITC